ncbi:hypothetical protein, partial [Loktanella sp. IMCC34160]|uniref:hypothetical protein n=1 Tax=Loktanella sp. IMCC34160 TaxID=2510646 RepID=UPI001A939964
VKLTSYHRTAETTLRRRYTDIQSVEKQTKPPTYLFKIQIVKKQPHRKNQPTRALLTWRAPPDLTSV